jgi:hypothetical protein
MIANLIILLSKGVREIGAWKAFGLLCMEFFNEN